MFSYLFKLFPTTPTTIQCFLMSSNIFRRRQQFFPLGSDSNHPFSFRFSRKKVSSSKPELGSPSAATFHLSTQIILVGFQHCSIKLCYLLWIKNFTLSNSVFELRTIWTIFYINENPRLIRKLDLPTKTFFSFFTRRQMESGMGVCVCTWLP